MFFNNHKLILASQSPRRQQLLKDLGVNFKVITKDIQEDFPDSLKAEQIPLFLSKHKADSYSDELEEDKTIVVTADTIVWLEGKVLNKPIDSLDAERMLQLLSGKMHEVFTGVCIMSKQKTAQFFVASQVYFQPLSLSAIRSYIAICKPFDKAGSYGAQECLPTDLNPCSIAEIDFLKKHNKLDLIEKSIFKAQNNAGFACVKKIEGSYFNVMGLPLKETYEALEEFVS